MLFPSFCYLSFNFDFYQAEVFDVCGRIYQSFVAAGSLVTVRREILTWLCSHPGLFRVNWC